MVLDAFDVPSRLTLAEIVRQTGLPRSSAHRMLERLVQLKWLRREGRDYELGIRLVELGSTALHQDRIRQAAIPLLRDLHRATGLVVHLAVLDGPDVVYLEKIGDQMAAAIPSRIGGRQPAHSSSVGKAILADSDTALVDLTRRKTRFSIATPQQLSTELSRVRAHGVAFERDESLPGYGCVAAPIGLVGEAVAAVSVCGPMSHITFDQQLSGPVRMTAPGIWRSAEFGPDRTTAPVAADAAVARRPSISTHSRTSIIGDLKAGVMLDPQISKIIESLDAGFPAVYAMTGAEARAEIHSRFVANPQPAPVAAVEDHEFAVDDARINVRVYRPDAPGPLPCWCTPMAVGSCSVNWTTMTGYVAALPTSFRPWWFRWTIGWLPQHRWPIAAEDLYAASNWAVERAAEFGADPSRVAVGGDSAGGNLAAVTALVARDRGGPTLAAQLLLYPVIAADFDTNSCRQFGRGFYNPRPALQWYWDQYVPVGWDQLHTYASPLRANLEGLPPTVVVIAAHDPLRDEGISYANAQERSGVSTTRCILDGGIHGFMTMPTLDFAHLARRQASKSLGDLLGC